MDQIGISDALYGLRLSFFADARSVVTQLRHEPCSPQAKLQPLTRQRDLVDRVIDIQRLEKGIFAKGKVLAFWQRMLGYGEKYLIAWYDYLAL